MSHVMASYIAVLALDSKRRRQFLGNPQAKLDKKLAEAQEEIGNSLSDEDSKSELRDALELICKTLEDVGQASQEPETVPVNPIHPL